MSLNKITKDYIKAIEAEIKKLTEARDNALRLLGEEIQVDKLEPMVRPASPEGKSSQKIRQERERENKIKKIIDILKEYGELSTDEIAKKLPLHVNTLRKYLKTEYFESHRAGYWRLKN